MCMRLGLADCATIDRRAALRHGCAPVADRCACAMHAFPVQVTSRPLRVPRCALRVACARHAPMVVRCGLACCAALRKVNRHRVSCALRMRSCTLGTLTPGDCGDVCATRTSDGVWCACWACCEARCERPWCMQVAQHAPHSARVEYRAKACACKASSGPCARLRSLRCILFLSSMLPEVAERALRAGRVHEMTHAE